MGRYDIVTISEAPDDATAAKVALTVDSAGNVTTETLRVFNEDEYREIFRRACARLGIEYDDGAVTYLLRQRYPGAGLPLRACHPWDLMAQLSDFANWRNQPPTLTKDLMDESWDTYFAKL